MFVRSAWLMMLAVTTASATPVELTHQGRLLDAAGVPLNDGNTSLTFDLQETGSPPIDYWTETLNVSVADGFYSVVLGADSGNPLQAEWFSADPQLRVSDAAGNALASQVIRPVPTALSSYSLSGGPVDASELRVDGSAAWVSPGTTCAADSRGAFRFIAGSSSVADALQWCADDGSGALEWRAIGAIDSADPPGQDINPPGTLLISSSSFVDPNPPSGWTQCAGFINTSGNDVTENVLDGCLPVERMRIRMWNASGVLVDDQFSESGNGQATSSWPSWNYVTGGRTAVVSTYWISTAGFFATTDGRDACGQSTGGSRPHLGTGNGTCAAIFPGHSNDSFELGRNCSGSAYVDFTIAVYR
jgi:hypothetical protein